MISNIARKEVNREDADLLLWMTKGCQLTIVDSRGHEKKRTVYVDDYTGTLRKFSSGLFSCDGTKHIARNFFSIFIKFQKKI